MARKKKGDFEMIQKRTVTATVGMAFLAMLALGISKCSSSSTTPPPPDNTTKTFTTSSDNAHTHQVTLTKAEVENPPAAGVSKTTTSASAHTHSFVMTQGELMTVDGGGSVTVTTGSSDVGGAHTHTVTISKWF
jgi:hypothetical protein